jgi:hypothetical protein
MSTYWALNGVQLIEAEVDIQPTRAPVRRNIRQALEALHGGTEHREKTGKDLPRITIEISFLGAGIEKFEQATIITDILDDDDVWTLEAPEDAPMSIYKDAKRAAFSTVSWTLDPQEATGRITLTIEAIVNGIWIADSGTYRECTSGYFTLQSTGPSVYIREDGTNTGATPLVALPLQSTGYPKAIKASDYSEDTPALGSTFVVFIDGGAVVYGNYNMTGYLIPAPSVAGDVGVYKICSSPAEQALSASYPASQMTVFDFGTMTAHAIEELVGVATMSIFDFSPVSGTAIRAAQSIGTMGTFDFGAILVTSGIIAAADADFTDFDFSPITASATLLEILQTEDLETMLTEDSEEIFAEL